MELYFCVNIESYVWLCYNNNNNKKINNMTII